MGSLSPYNAMNVPSNILKIIPYILCQIMTVPLFCSLSSLGEPLKNTLNSISFNWFPFFTVLFWGMLKAEMRDLI